MSLFGWIKNGVTRIKQRLKEPISRRAKATILIVVLVVIIGGSIIAYKVYDYTQNDPTFCVSCHIMDTSYSSWQASEHKSVNCHECHHLTVSEAIKLLYGATFTHPTSVPARHKGEFIVDQHYCLKCHTGGKAKRIDSSPFHMKHVSLEKKECTECHGEVKPDKSGLHRFLPSEKFCTKCHEGKQVHGGMMGALACLNCHTEQSKDLRPTREKCLFCHSNDENTRKQVLTKNTIDVHYFPPKAAIVKQASKIQISKQAPMQFSCYECHRPHTKGKVRPMQTDCLRCHGDIRNVGKHGMHLDMNMNCKDCHQPHLWKVTDETAKTACVKCHELRGPKTFL